MTGYSITATGINRQIAMFVAEFDEIGLGTGTTDPLETDTQLENEVYRAPATLVSSVGGQLIYDLTVPVGTLDATITELGLFNAHSGGVMYCREVREGVVLDENIGAIFEMRPFIARTVA